MWGFDRIYKSRLQKDVMVWQEQGIIDAATAGRIISSAKTVSGSTWHFTRILFILGMVLMLFSALSFVGANWQEMSRGAKLILLLGIMWALLGAGWWSRRAGHRIIAETTLFGAAGMFGINIALISQIFHIDGHLPDGIFLAAIGALLIAGLLKGYMVLSLAWVLLLVWTGLEIIRFNAGFHWVYIPMWLIATFISWQLRSRVGVILSALSLILWTGTSYLSLMERNGFSDLGILSTLILMGLFFVALAVFLMDVAGSHQRIGEQEKARSSGIFAILEPKGINAGLLSVFAKSMFTIVIISLFYILIILQIAGYSNYSFILRSNISGFTVIFALLISVLSILLASFSLLRGKRNPVYFLVPLALGLWALLLLLSAWLKIVPLYELLTFTFLIRLMTLAYALWAIYLGQIWRENWLVILGLIAFAIEVLIIYVKLFGSLMDTALFFFLGGVLLLAGGYYLDQWRRKLLAQNTNQGEAR